MRAITAVIVSGLLLAACSSDPAATSSPPTSSAPAKSEPPASAAASATTEGPIVLTHTLGETELDAPAERVVALEWDYAEDLLALGVEPVGIAGADIYNDYLGGFKLPATVEDVGTRQEPSLESIAALEPDLIIAVGFRHEPIYDQLTSIAPTVVFEPSPDDPDFDAWDEMRETFLTIGQGVGREAEAQTYLDDLDASLDDASERIAAAGLETNTFVLSNAYTNQDVAEFRLFLDNAISVQILERMGLENVFVGTGAFEQYGFSTLGVEALPEVQDANFIYLPDIGDDVMANVLDDNEVWTQLGFVTEDRVYALPTDAWLFPGPPGALYLVESVLDALGV